jgi:predicted nucleotidyltransferase
VSHGHGVVVDTDARARVPEALLKAVVETFDPQAVILFGSRARGEAHADSDWDLLVIVDEDARARGLTLEKGYEAARRAGVTADVIPCRRSWFDYKRDVVGSLAWTAAEEGVVVYGRA